MRTTGTHRRRKLWIAGVMAFGMALFNAPIPCAAPPRIGFLAVESSLDEMGLHNRAAWRTATKLGQATLLLRQKDGTFVDPAGRTLEGQSDNTLTYNEKSPYSLLGYPFTRMSSL